MAARRLHDEESAPPVHHQRSWWWWGVEYTIVSTEIIRAELVAVRGAVGEAKDTKDAAVAAHAKACEIVQQSHPRIRPVEQEIVVRVRREPTRRGCCSRCDRCGEGFSPPGEAGGCRPGAPPGQPSLCGKPDKIRRRSDCAGCSRPYEPTPRPKAVPEGQYEFHALFEDDTDFTEPPKVTKKGDRKWTDAPRASSITWTETLTRKERRLHLKLSPWYGQAPKNRSECADVPRPCPYVTCSMNNYLDIDPDTGTIRLNFPHLDPTEMKDSCALDVAERDGIICEELGQILNVSHEGASQLVDKALLEFCTKADTDALPRLIRRLGLNREDVMRVLARPADQDQEQAEIRETDT